MMLIAMLAGFLTSYPVNWWLLRAGINEKCDDPKNAKDGGIVALTAAPRSGG